MNIPVDEIELIKEEAVVWPDSSLGYPKPEMVYLMVLTPGSRIILKARNILFEYHSDNKRIVRPGISYSSEKNTE